MPPRADLAKVSVVAIAAIGMHGYLVWFFGPSKALFGDIFLPSQWGIARDRDQSVDEIQIPNSVIFSSPSLFVAIPPIFVERNAISFYSTFLREEVGQYFSCILGAQSCL